MIIVCANRMNTSWEVLGKLRQEDCYNFEATLGYIVCSRPAGVQSETLCQKHKTNQSEKTCIKPHHKNSKHKNNNEWLKHGLREYIVSLGNG